jgi:hypothetical protein
MAWLASPPVDHVSGGGRQTNNRSGGHATAQGEASRSDATAPSCGPRGAGARSPRLEWQRISELLRHEVGAGSGGSTRLLAWAHRASTTAAHITCMCGPREGRGAGAGNRLKRGGDGRQRNDEERPDRWVHTNQYISTCSRLVSSTLRRQINFVKDVLDLLHCEPIDKFSDVNVHFESLKI